MTQFVRTLWSELIGSIGEAVSLVGGEGGPAIDVTALTVRVLVSPLVLLVAWAAYALARRGLDGLLRRTRFPATRRSPRSSRSCSTWRGGPSTAW